MNQVKQVDHLENLENLLRDGRLARAEEQRKFGSALTDATRSLQQAAVRFEGLARMSGAACEARPALNSEERSRLAAMCNDLRRAGQQIASAARDGSEEHLREVRHLVKDVEATTTRIEDALSSAWQRRADREFSRADALAGLLQKVPETQHLGHQLKAVAQKGLQWKKQFPPDAPGLAEFQSLITRTQALLEELATSGADDDVVDFLQATVEGRARLNDCSQRTRSWLQERGALGLFRVTLG